MPRFNLAVAQDIIDEHNEDDAYVAQDVLDDLENHEAYQSLMQRLDEEEAMEVDRAWDDYMHLDDPTTLILR